MQKLLGTALKHQKLGDEAWFGRIKGSGRAPAFGLPDVDIQKRTVGKYGDEALRDAWMFWRFVCRMAERHSNVIGRKSTILEFGVSWGRILRFFLRDTDAYCLAGVDETASLLAEARRVLPGDCDLRLRHSLPPLPYCENSFDIIYAFSGFSHLPRSIADAWAFEFRRILKPGGLVCLTTRPKRHLRTEEWKILTGGKVEDYEKQYDLGEFVFIDGRNISTSRSTRKVESIIPPDYARKNWPFEFIGFEEKYSETYLQPCCVLRKSY
ncbi:class I SAM-dependent methyltransferase [Ensifer adhaerens]|uniref:class I SAM-dependent methyltransferase n=1 Tax=Ensifer adhaerens TaxID=106592 RepID=UPI001CBADF0A|nr:class I SAM-dependent methyltransferase [Ensifer adhaerens]UAX95103.1 class I SAM-dependent methyltransferase [Ensifer adhaerens]UAY03005.1 class I SAM-dependent methyltransferase [Ensifer adhaerens]UAY10990.1 class I SAM-dependent methyltransferase [Ensifer adhaerens]